MRKWLLLPMLFGYAAAAAHAEEFTARVVVVIDGDTVMVVRDCSRPQAPEAGAPQHCAANLPQKIRLAEIDAPEKDQPGGEESRQALAHTALKKQVRVQVEAVDKYQRLVAHLSINGVSVNEAQVRSGMAWEYSGYHRNQAYLALQEEAQHARRGLWAQSHPIPPWEWRKTHQSDAPALARSHPRPAQGPDNHPCGNKQHCSQMRSCAEAKFYLEHCGLKSLDGNGDGVPCENLCSLKE